MSKIRGQRPHLTIVDEAYQAPRRAYVLMLDVLEGTELIARLDEQDLVVINGDEDRLADEVDLRVHLMGLAVADDLYLPNDWWTSATAHQLVTIASWMRLPYRSYTGERIDVASAAR